MQKIGDIPNTRADSNGEFTDGNVAGGVPPTILPAEWFNTIQRELISVLTLAGITPDRAKFNQVATAVAKLITDGGFLKTTNNLVEIKNAGATAVAATLANLDLSDVVTKANGSAQKSNNLSDLADKSLARNSLELGTAATRAVGTGTNQIPDMNSFGASFGASGYQKLPGGLILQWGRVTTTAALIGTQWNFPITFPNAALSYFAMTENSSGDSKYSNIGPISAASRTGATVSSTYPGTASNSCWAIGY
ncbi:gp53-like domain-containing protein [Yersinia canariae]|uniref:gp53-like domain-containing protein n=1 Tax=Yersinia canariae TaxID=2607663 RepID=UPI0031B5AE19